MQLVVVSAVMAAVIIADTICHIRIQVSFEIFIAKFLLPSKTLILLRIAFGEKLNKIYFKN